MATKLAWVMTPLDGLQTRKSESHLMLTSHGVTRSCGNKKSFNSTNRVHMVTEFGRMVTYLDRILRLLLKTF